jgi:6-phosphogluconolactonase
MPIHVSRRTLLQSLLATSALRAAGLTPLQPPPSTQWVLIGTGKGKGMYRAPWKAAIGELGEPELAIATPAPTYLTAHPHLPLIYACNEVDGPNGTVSAFGLDRASASLRHLGTEESHGEAPCFASVDRSGKLLFAANYGGGSLAVFPLGPQGDLQPAATVFQCAEAKFCGTGGPVKERQSAAHLHCATLSPDSRYVLSCDLGDDAILVFPIHPGAAHPLGPVTRVATKPGAGPRHLAFHPNGRWLYCINEIDCTVAQYRWNPQGSPQAVQVVDGTVGIRPTHVPDDSSSTGAEIAITRDGGFAYTSTRFTNVLTVFSVNPASGLLQQVQQLACGGKTPRFFGLAPDERWLLCANQDSNDITVFRRDPHTGLLSSPQTRQAPNPECLLFV